MCFEFARIMCVLYAIYFEQIETKKLVWQTDSKIGSLKNVTHSPGGGHLKVCVSYLSVRIHVFIYCSSGGPAEAT